MNFETNTKIFAKQFATCSLKNYHKKFLTSVMWPKI